MIHLEVYNALVKSLNVFSTSSKHVEAILRVLIVMLRGCTVETSFASWNNLKVLYRVAGDYREDALILSLIARFKNNCRCLAGWGVSNPAC